MIKIIHELGRDFKFALVSGSPRRKELLQEIGMDFKIIVPQTPEVIRDRFYRQDIVTAARAKLEAGPPGPNKILIACDTIVVYNQKVFGKPQNSRQAANYLKTLSGKMHRVLSCVALKVITAQNVKYYQATETTRVYFRQLEQEEIEEYINTPEPYDKAGGYGAQSSTLAFVKKINGCYYNVIGLPLYKLLELLTKVKGDWKNGIL
jgi:septum formation protein